MKAESFVKTTEEAIKRPVPTLRVMARRTFVSLFVFMPPFCCVWRAAGGAAAAVQRDSFKKRGANLHRQVWGVENTPPVRRGKLFT